jgi:hypothetical protein
MRVRDLGRHVQSEIIVKVDIAIREPDQPSTPHLLDRSSQYRIDHRV